jgi:hypothetical protein
VTAYIYNKTPGLLVLNYYDNIFGSFVTYPPYSIQPGAIGNFTMTGAGAIAYNIYYQSGYFYGCAQLSYIWDFVFGKCDSVCASCGSKRREISRPQIASERNATDDAGRICLCAINDDCPVFGDTLHTVSALC